MKQLIAILGVAIFAGCASNTPKQKPQLEAVENDKTARVSRKLSIAWDNMGRGGAALRQPNYIHVLGDSNVSTTMNQDTYKGKGYSLYELSRWERYCDGGKGMDEHDWHFVVVEETMNIPKDVVTSCTPPTHTYQDYLNAWTHFCTSQAITDANRRIVHESVRPYSVVNPCKALK